MVFANKLINALLLASLALTMIACDREPEQRQSSPPQPNPYLGVIPLESMQLPAGEPAPGSRFSVQVGLYENMQNAATVIETLSKNNYQLMVNRVVDSQGVEQNLLRIGEYTTMEEASVAATKLKEITGNETKVILLPQ